MADTTERRQALRRNTDGMGLISFGQEPIACRVIDVSETGAQIRIDGRRASRNLVGKRTQLKLDTPSDSEVEGRVVWARPAVNGVYLGIELSRAGAAKPATAEASGE
jgi:hypothetical protein